MPADIIDRITITDVAKREIGGMPGTRRSLLLLPPLLALAMPGAAAEPDLPWLDIIRDAAEGLARVRRENDAFLLQARGGPASRMAMIRIAAAGTFLDPATYEQRFAAADAAQRARDFPAIGKRAMLSFASFGPGGGVTALVSTTIDGRYDLEITRIETGSRDAEAEGGEDPLDPHGLTRRVHAAYAQRLSAPG